MATAEFTPCRLTVESNRISRWFKYVAQFKMKPTGASSDVSYEEFRCKLRSRAVCICRTDAPVFKYQMLLSRKYISCDNSLYKFLEAMALGKWSAAHLSPQVPRSRFHDLFDRLPEELREMIWVEFENVPRPCMYTILGFVRKDIDLTRQLLDNVLKSIPRTIPNKLKPRYKDPEECDVCHPTNYFYFDKFEAERDILFLGNRQTDGPDWIQRESILFGLDYRNFAAVRYLVYRTPYQHPMLQDMDIQFLSNFPLLKVLWLEHPNAETEASSLRISNTKEEIERKKIEQEKIEKEIARSIIAGGFQRVQQESWGNFQIDTNNSNRHHHREPKPEFENIQYQVPKIIFITEQQLTQLCGYYQMNMCGEIEEDEWINEDLEEGEIDESRVVKTFGMLRENIDPDFNLF